MPESSAIWPMDPHTHAKHEILEEYLKAWFPILSQTSRRIIYLDGFAGPGVYSAGEEGSPAIAVRTAATHKLAKYFHEILFHFIEKDAERARTLTRVFSDRFPNLPPNLKYYVHGAEFAPTLESVLDGLEKRGARLAPTLAFLDPFGFSGLPMHLIARMLSYQKCEVLITFMAGFVNRFTDEMREEVLDELYATPDWRPVRAMSQRDKRQQFLLDLYVKQLKKLGGARFVRTFEIRGKFNQLIYYLVFATKHLKGLEVMKEAMFEVDERGTYKFSDYTDAGQSFLIDYSNEPSWVPIAAESVFQKFRGKTVNIDEVHTYVIAETRFVDRRSILRLLEKSNPPRIIAVSRRKSKALAYPEDCSVTFSQ